MDTDIIIIGAGAAGLMAAYGAASSKASVLLLEKMPRPGRKIMITGKGRCNYTNMKNWSAFAEHVHSDITFARPSFYNLTPQALTEFLENHGLKTVVERGDRAYPASYKASDVVDTLVKAATDAGAKIECDCEVTRVERLEDCFRISCGSRAFTSRALIIATGGLSYPATGSTGDGYVWAEDFDHTVKTCFPSLTAMVPEGYKQIPPRMPQGAFKGHIDRSLPLAPLGEKLCGVSLKNVSASLYNVDILLQTEFGELAFTDGGIEGPIGFTLSRNCVKSVMNGNRVTLAIDLKPSVSAKQLKERILSLMEETKDTSKILRNLLPAELLPAFLEIVGRNPSADALVKTLKEWTFNIVGYVGYERCVITAGGISTREVVPKSLESRLVDGLFFCGEILDIDCDTGGYNLQWAFCSGYMAGQSAAKFVNK